MVYVVPHFRYGALIFYPEVTKDNKLSKNTVAYIKLFNNTVKTIWRLPKTTREELIKDALG